MDQPLDDLMRAARDAYRVPPPADLDALWPRIEAEHFDRPRALAPVVSEALVLDAAPLAGTAEDGSRRSLASRPRCSSAWGSDGSPPPRS